MNGLAGRGRAVVSLLSSHIMRVFDIYTRSLTKNKNIILAVPKTAPRHLKVPKTQSCCRIFQMFRENTDKPYISGTSKLQVWCSSQMQHYIMLHSFWWNSFMKPGFWQFLWLEKQNKNSTTWKSIWNRNAGGCVKAVSKVWEVMQCQTDAHISVGNQLFNNEIKIFFLSFPLPSQIATRLLGHKYLLRR